MDPTEAALLTGESGEAPGGERGVLGYVGVWIILLCLTALNYGVSKLHLGGLELVLESAIMVTKSSLVMVFFMHFLHESGASRVSVAVALIFIGSLALLVVADNATRFPLAVVRESGVPTAPRPDFPPPRNLHGEVFGRGFSEPGRK